MLFDLTSLQDAQQAIWTACSSNNRHNGHDQLLQHSALPDLALELIKAYHTDNMHQLFTPEPRDIIALNFNPGFWAWCVNALEGSYA